MASIPQAIAVNGISVDLSGRFAFSNAVTGSPATNAATAVCTTPALSQNAAVTAGCIVCFNIAFTVGTSGTAVTYKIRQGTTAGSGTTVFSSGATTAGISAGNLVVENVIAVDSAPVLPGQQYILEVTVTGGAATSTVSAASGWALVI